MLDRCLLVGGLWLWDAEQIAEDHRLSGECTLVEAECRLLGNGYNVPVFKPDV